MAVTRRGLPLPLTIVSGAECEPPLCGARRGRKPAVEAATRSTAQRETLTRRSAARLHSAAWSLRRVTRSVADGSVSDCYRCPRESAAGGRDSRDRFHVEVPRLH